MARNIFLPGRLCLLFGLYVFITVANLEEKEEKEEEILYLQYTRWMMILNGLLYLEDISTKK